MRNVTETGNKIRTYKLCTKKKYLTKMEMTFQLENICINKY